ncbi:hypothetical protein CXT98_05995 [Akkermansia muciniphila]|nr:hypothetical protein CXT98_05995 [Akkermansia muciniphila]
MTIRCQLFLKEFMQIIGRESLIKNTEEQKMSASILLRNSFMNSRNVCDFIEKKGILCCLKVIDI